MADTVISTCGTYRYRLHRWLGQEGRDSGQVCFVMLNPSTADAQNDDPTIRRCKGFAAGYRSLAVVNLYAFRSAYPADLKRAAFPVGDDNNYWISDTLEESDLIICAWGQCGPIKERPAQIVTLLAPHMDRVRVLGYTKGGEPRHPLYMSKGAPLLGFDIYV